MTWLWLSCLALLVGGEIDDAIDEVRGDREGYWGHIPVKHEEGRTAFPITPEVGQMKISTKDKDKRDRGIIRAPVQAVAPSENGNGISTLAKRVGDDLTTLAKNHLELARIEMTSGAKRAIGDGAAIILGGILGLIGLAMLCVTLVVAAEPLIAALWLRLLLGALLYIAIGAGLIFGFLRKLRGATQGIKDARREAERTVQVLKEQIQNG